MAAMIVCMNTATASRCSLRTQGRSMCATRLTAAVPTTRRARLSCFVTKAADYKGVLTDVQKIVADNLGKPEAECTETAKFDDLGADSLDTVELVMALEEKFEIQLDEEGAEKIITVGDAAKAVLAKIEAA